MDQVRVEIPASGNTPENTKAVVPDGAMKVEKGVSDDGQKEITRVSVDSEAAAQAAAAAQRPEWMPEKFKEVSDLKAATVALLEKQGVKSLAAKISGMEDGEAIAAIYRSYEKDLGKPKDDKSEEKPDDEKKEEDKPEESAPLSAEDQEGAVKTYGSVLGGVLNKAGVRGQELADTFLKDGKLTDAQYAKLDAAGFPRETVDTFFAGATARGTTIATAQLAELHTIAGGADKLTEMLTWAAKGGMDPNDVAHYNALVDSGKLDLQKKAVEGLRKAFMRDNGSEPKLLGGDAPSGRKNEGPGFRSWNEFQEAMKDPRYKANDPAYHADVDAKLRRSTF